MSDRVLSEFVEKAYFAPLELASKPRKKWVLTGPSTTGEMLRRASAEGIDLEVESNKNFLNFYRVELEAGNFSALSRGCRKTLRRFGLIEGQGDKVALSEKGRRLLGEIQK